MVKPSHILGINARNQLYTSLNSKESKRIGFSKLKTKSFLQRHNIPVAKLYAKITTPEELRNFPWQSIEGAFALKPANGSAGKGIVVIKRRDKKKGTYIDVAGEHWTRKDLELHISDILQGAFSTWQSQNAALIEERVPVHPDMEAYVAMGTPDVRVIVFNRIPVMAMIRLPTKASRGRANLDQGALALGIDMGTGETTYGVYGKKTLLRVFPGTSMKTAGIPIPFWMDVLKTAVRAANACGYTYMGCDVFLHPEKGPMVAEVNGFPGLSIQLANHAGLKRRLERVEEIEARNVSHAVRIGQALFAENYPISSEGELTVISPKERVLILDDEEKGHEARALINTGRFRSAISRETAKKLGLLDANDLLWNQEVEGEGKVPVIEVKFKLKDRIIKTTMVATKNLDGKPQDIEVGRKDLVGFLVGDIQ